MTFLTGETASSTQKVVAPFLRNHWTNQHQNKVSYLFLDCLGTGHSGFLIKGHKICLVEKLIFLPKDFRLKFDFYRNDFLMSFFQKSIMPHPYTIVKLSAWSYSGDDWSNSYGGNVLQRFEYSKLFLHLERSCKLSNGLNDLKVGCYVFLNHTDHAIHSDHSF